MDLGLTQAQLAHRLGCLMESVGARERGLSEPNVTRWPALQAVLGLTPIPDRDCLPEGVRAARIRLGFAQEELAQRAGVHVRTIRNAESGTQTPSQLVLSRLREVLGQGSS